jgi:ABC-type transporter Mla subunit MlaD
VSIPDPFDVEPVHITIHDNGRTPEEIVAELREKYPPRLALLEQTAEKLGAAKARISTLEALTDQLAEALRDAMENMDGWASYASDYFRMKHNLSGDLAEIARAIAAAEADKEAHR